MMRGTTVATTSNSNLSGYPFPSSSIPSTSANNGNTATSLGNASNGFYYYQSFAAIPSQSNTQIGNGNQSFREAPTPGPSSMTTGGLHSTDTDTEIESDVEMELDHAPEQLGGIKSAGSFVDVVGASAATPTATATYPEDVVGLYDDDEDADAGCSQSYYHQHFQSQHPGQNRSASPVPTEIEDPEPEYLERQLVMHGAKIRDFAYEKTDDRYTLTKIPELWDQYEGISEYEYRLSQNPRIYPISGRTIHRLIGLGWVDRDEVEERCAGMDLDELRKFESREIWPWTLKYKNTPKCTERPSMSERMLHMHARRWIFVRLDKMRRAAELQEFKKLREKAEVEEAIRKGREFSEVMSKRKGKKRALDEDDEEGEGEDFDGDVECDVQSSPGGRSSKRRSRRRRTKKTNWDEELDLEFDYGDQHHDHNRSSPFSRLPSPPPMPTKQYPAPLFSYDPQLYPDAAKEIEFQQSQSQQYSQQLSQLCGLSYLQQSQAAAAAASGSQQPYSSYQEYQQQQAGGGSSSQAQAQGSQYQPVYSIYPARPVHDKERPAERCDTPPLEEEDNRPNKLVRPAKRGLGLTRTQTFTQL